MEFVDELSDFSDTEESKPRSIFLMIAEDGKRDIEEQQRKRELQKLLEEDIDEEEKLRLQRILEKKYRLEKFLGEGTIEEQKEKHKIQKSLEEGEVVITTFKRTITGHKWFSLEIEKPFSSNVLNEQLTTKERLKVKLQAKKNERTGW